MENNTKNIVFATGAGLAVGALLGVLFAPAKGEATRATIKNKVSGLKDKVSQIDPLEMLSELKGKVEAKFQEEKSEAKDELLAQINALEKVIEQA